MKKWGVLVIILTSLFFWSCQEEVDVPSKDSQKEVIVTNGDELTCRYPPQEFTTEEKREVLNIINNFGLGLLEAQETKKPICLIFTGYAVINGARIEDYILNQNPIIYNKLKNDYINVWLYCDDKTEDMGKKNMNLHYSMTKSLTLPSLVIVSPEGIPGKMLLDYDVILTDIENTL